MHSACAVPCHAQSPRGAWHLKHWPREAKLWVLQLGQYQSPSRKDWGALQAGGAAERGRVGSCGHALHGGGTHTQRKPQAA